MARASKPLVFLTGLVLDFDLLPEVLVVENGSSNLKCPGKLCSSNEISHDAVKGIAEGPTLVAAVEANLRGLG